MNYYPASLLCANIDSPGFGTVLFTSGDDNNLYAQRTVDGDTISEFFRVEAQSHDFEKGNYLSISSNEYRTAGDDLLFAFVAHDRRYEVGDWRQVVYFAHKDLRNFENRPLLYNRIVQIGATLGLPQPYEQPSYAPDLLGGIQSYRGGAGSADEAIRNPLALLSRPIFLDERGEPDPELRRWEVPRHDGDKGTAAEFQRHIRTDPLVVIGGFEFLVELGVISTWLTNDQTRKDARKLIAERGWIKILDSLGARGKERDGIDLIGKNAIFQFFQHSPEVRRESAIRPRRVMGKSIKVRAEFAIAKRRHHCLRLRKAVEVLTLIEAALRYRFQHGKTLRRTQNYTGLERNEIYPEVIWDVCWFEPVNYTLNYLPNEIHLREILEDKSIVQRFVEDSGQQTETLWWILRGLPGKYRTVEAAAGAYQEAVDSFPLRVTTVMPGEYKRRMKLLHSKASRKQKLGLEFIAEMGPEKANWS